VPSRRGRGARRGDGGRDLRRRGPGCDDDPRDLLRRPDGTLNRARAAAREPPRSRGHARTSELRAPRSPARDPRRGARTVRCHHHAARGRGGGGGLARATPGEPHGPSAGLELLPRDQAFDKLLQARYLVERLSREWTWAS
jgi:hypothetical protein